MVVVVRFLVFQSDSVLMPRKSMLWFQNMAGIRLTRGDFEKHTHVADSDSDLLRLEF